ncbi:CaiB/BaiF CoA transferase family protein [[Mycobacterium] vasticus]|uniref:CoA transferase n=1 Tax=[Mycobacterium] vasticus TaxID=2875777 RepID=A0ABU5YYR7_9MYCO|nr:CoA transferase [Mycolicibacter sp. MYC017]MEB3070281.1 CoA transferase [Mycolicibacter sp. MYC017]
MFLDGVRVLDLTDERGLLAGRVLADLGADVVQVEPVNGSSARHRKPLPPGDTTRSSYVWQTYAANKRGIVADLATEHGAELIRSLAGVADVLIESADPGVLADRGLDFADLQAVNPGLVYVSITAFGRTGPKAHLKAPDLVAWAAGGPLDEHRDGDRPPLRISLPQAYLHASLDAAAGAQLALAARRRTGRGQLVDVAVQTSLTTATLGHALTYSVGDVPRDMTKGHVLEAPRIDQSGSGANTDPTLKKWTCRDGMIEFHIGIGPASGAFTNDFIAWLADEGAPVDDFRKLDFRALPEQIASGEFSDADSTRLRAVIKDFLATRTKAEVLDAAIARKLLCVPICDIGDILASPQLAARDFFVTVGAGDNAVRLPGPFAHTSVPDAVSVRRRAPGVGEHQQEVLEEWLGTRPPVAGTAFQPGSAPLEGLKVVDFSWVVAGPLIGRALADFGATVIRVESAGRIETARFMQPFVNGQIGPESSALYGTCNAGKLGMTLNLGTEQGRAVAHRLADWADVVIESFSPGRMTHWGLDYQTLSRNHPDLVMLSTSINGQFGPHAQLAGYGNVGAALSGYQFLTGWPDRAPIGPFGPYTDYVGPRASLSTLLAALAHRDRTGQGCYLDVAQVEAGIWLQAPEVADCAANGMVAARLGNADRELAPHGVFRCRPDADSGEDRYVAIVVTDDAEWAALTETISRHDLRDDDRLRSADGRLAHAAEIESAIAQWAAANDIASAETLLQQAGVPAHRSASSRDLAEDPQIAHRGHFVRVSHPLFGHTVVEGPRYLLSDTPGSVRCAAPTFGQDNDYVLTQVLGLDADEVAQLQQDGVLR